MPHPGPQIIPISDPADPRLADYANLKDKQLAALATPDSPPGLFMAEGELVVRQLILSPLTVRSVLITPTRLASMEDALAALPAHVPVFLTSLEAMSAIVGFHIHRGVLAAGIRPAAPDPHALIAQSQTLVLLEDLANHDNVGGIFRTVAALAGFDGTSVLLSPRCCDPLYRKAIRVSMGTALRLPFATLSPWPDSLEAIRRAGFRIYALTPDAAAAPIEQVHPTGRVALLLGSEGPGLSPSALSRVDELVRIPMAVGVDSLNVVVAAGIALNRLISTNSGPPS